MKKKSADIIPGEDMAKRIKETQKRKIFEIGDIKKETITGDEHEIAIGEKHRLGAGPMGIQVLEIATGDFNESDIIHYEDKYGRV